MTLETRPGRTSEVRIDAWQAGARGTRDDAVATEEPLQIRLLTGGRAQSLAVTMRTPGNDFELAAGFVYGESLVRTRDDLDGITYCLDDLPEGEQRYNVVNVSLHHRPARELDTLERHFTLNSSCGICGRAQLEDLRARGLAPLADDLCISMAAVYALPERMRARQRVFEATGGLHAAGLFDESGEPSVVREDVGRHNAVDKVVGWGMLNDALPFARSLLLVSGRVSYEIVAKAATAGIPAIAAVSAPSSLAVDLARAFNVTLIGFVRGDRANVYSAPHRVRP